MFILDNKQEDAKRSVLVVISTDGPMASNGVMAQPIRPSADTPTQVLLVEDDELVRARLERLLGLANFDVYGVSTAQAAREFVTALVFPMVVIDRMLEDADGIALIRELRQHYSQHRVFLMLFSALDSEEERRKGLNAGADEYLSKRASDEEIVARLKAARSHVRLIK